MKSEIPNWAALLMGFVGGGALGWLVGICKGYSWGKAYARQEAEDERKYRPGGDRYS